MALSDRTHSRLLRGLKVVLPLAAIGLLSTLFLFSRGPVADADLPYSRTDLRDLAQSERMTRPTFAGATETGALIGFTADTATPLPDNRLESQNLSAEIDLVSGQTIAFVADEGILATLQDMATLTGGVVITTSTGYRITTDALDTGLTEIRAQSHGPVQADGPPGDFTAGQMLLTTNPDTGGADMVFTDGVKLIYDPRKTQETNP